MYMVYELHILKLACWMIIIIPTADWNIMFDIIESLFVVVENIFGRLFCFQENMIFDIVESLPPSLPF